MADPTEQEKAEAAKAEAEKQAAETAAKEAEAKAAEEKAAADAAKLGDAGKAALDAERKARKDAEKAAKEAQKKLDDIEKQSLSETEKLKKEAEDGRKLAESATDKLRRANLITALADQGLAGGKARAAARLLDSVEYDDDDEPTNLDDAIKAAKAEYGEDMFKGAKPKPGPTDGGGGNDPEDGPKLTADELQMAKSFGMTAEEYAQFKSPTAEPAKT